MEHQLDGSETGKSLQVYLKELELKYPVRFYFLDSWIEDILLADHHKGQNVRTTLDELFLGTDLNYFVVNKYAVVIVKDPEQALQRQTFISDAVRQRKKIEQIQFGEQKNARLGVVVDLTGQIIDSKTGEALVGASIRVSNLNQMATSDINGRFLLKLPMGSHVINFSYINYDEKVIDLKLYEKGNMSLILDETPTLLEEVVVSDLASRQITTSRIGQTQLSVTEIKRQPSLLGEADLIRQIQVLSGVTTSGEGASGFNVRGGGVDQNLILYDGAPIFNSAHAFGFFSTFNAEAVRDVSFYKGGIPAEFGGRISSVLNITSKEGSLDEWNGNGGIGIISSNFMINGPLVKGKTTAAASIRTSYSDWMVNTVQTNYINLKNSSVRFYDATIKLAHKFSDETKLTFSGYTSKDRFRLEGDTTYGWDNLVGSIKLDHAFNPQFFSSFTFGAGSYGYQVEDSDPVTGYNLSYHITYPYFNTDFNLQSGKHKLTFGLQSMYYSFDPGILKPSTSESIVKEIVIDQQNSLESGIYLSDGITLNEKVFIEAGLRVSNFLTLGPATVYTYDPNFPRDIQYIQDTTLHNSGDVIKSFIGFEPRFSFRYSFSPTFSLKLGFNRIYQYVHLVTNTVAITPVDIWQPSNSYFEPQLADQISLGFFKTIQENAFDASVEGFFKEITNILDFKDGAQLILNQNLETDLLQGNGTAYGVETSFAKKTGRLSGSVNYTYSRSFRQITGDFDEENINKGNIYPSNYDQPHIVNLSWKYNLSRRIFFTGFFTYHTGRPVSIPVAAAVIDNFIIAQFSERNQFRIPDYHRLDLALVIEGNHRRKKLGDGTWVISVYNVYGRKNAYSVFFRDNGAGSLNPYQLSIVGTALPSISYNFKF